MSKIGTTKILEAANRMSQSKRALFFSRYLVGRKTLYGKTWTNIEMPEESTMIKKETT